MLNLEEDLPLTTDDFVVMRTPPPHNSKDLKSYLDFLQALGAFDSRKRDAKPYPEPFRLGCGGRP